jgi:ABC-type transport system substrate-binding protein/class 3 adenylate cyclase
MEAADSSGGASDIRTFLIADVRGYTRFTQEHGDEAGARLAATFAEVVADVVEASGGRVVELRGDEALVVFGSAREALRTAAELQRRFVELTREDSSLPLRVGIGLDAGEAVAVGEGFRGGALNLAARLCSIAAPGEVLVSDGVVHLARKVEEIEYVDRGRISVKGIREPVHVVEARFGLVLPVEAQPAPWWQRRRALAGLAAAVAAVVALGIATTLLGRSDSGLRIDANAVGQLDADKGKLVRQIPVGNGPSDVAVSSDSIWVTNAVDGTVSRVDLSGSRAGTTIDVGGDPEGVAVGAGGVWVARAAARSVVQINPESNTVVRTIPVGNGPAPVAVGDGAVWVGNTIDGTVSRVDPRSGRVTRVVAVGGQLADLAVSAESIWASRRDPGSVVRIDARTGRVVKLIAVGNGAAGLLATPGAIWVANSTDGTVSRIATDTGAVTLTSKVGGGPVALAAAAGAVWVANRLEDTLARVDMESGEVTRTIDVGGSPTAAVGAGDQVWATALAPVAAHRGGTLRVIASPSFCRCLDPAIAGDIARQRLNLALYDGLVGFRRVGGVAGNTLVPDLATSMPQAGDGGRTYSFQLRTGVRFSNGVEVRAGDVRSSFERLIRVNPVLPSYYVGIAGTQACMAHRARPCDLSRGIAVEEAMRTVTFRLTAPDPDFLYKLALPWAVVLPSRSPARQRPVSNEREARQVGPYLVPGTGPYKVARYQPGRQLRLVRNPYFQEWSKDAQPDGFPDVIEVREMGDAELGSTPPAAIRAVARGRADWVTGLPAADIRRLAVERPAQLRLSLRQGTGFMFLNTRIPPFTDTRARQALNFAVDRRKIVALVGGSGAAEVTCQLFPPTFTGYSPFCPYTRHPDARVWTAPDTRKARALVAATGTRGMRIGVLVGPPRGGRLGPYFVSVLRSLGYRAYLRPSSFVPGDALDPSKRAQIGELGWFQDYPSPSNFFEPLFSCHADLPMSRFCDARIDREAARATSLQLTEPIAAGEAWARVDRNVVDQAPFVPLFTPATAELVSRRVGNYQYNGVFGALLDQMWVR